MKFRKSTTAGVLLFGLGSATLAGPPPLDRPSPPPCCADGRCYSNPLTYGWYETRWRRWPLECLEPIAAGQAEGAAQPTTGIPIFDLPRPEDEDRKAPPPTAPREEPLKTPPPNAGPATENTTPPGQPMPPPGPPAPLQPGTPNESTRPSGTLPPYEPQTPEGRSLRGTGPTSELDPPPELPFEPRPIDERLPIREASQTPPIPAHQPLPNSDNKPSDDPPPSLPVTLATWSN